MGFDFGKIDFRFVSREIKRTNLEKNEIFWVSERPDGDDAVEIWVHGDDFWVD